jgi:hypothetical protein
MKTPSIALVLAGLIIGCGAGATVAVSWAGPTAGHWTCYSTHLIPDLNDGNDPKDLQKAQSSAANYSNLLNQTAPDAPLGATQFLGGVATAGVFGFFCAKN